MHLKRFQRHVFDRAPKFSCLCTRKATTEPALFLRQVANRGFDVVEQHMHTRATLNKDRFPSSNPSSREEPKDQIANSNSPTRRWLAHSREAMAAFLSC